MYAHSGCSPVYRLLNLVFSVVDAVQQVGTILGCDWSGHVVQRGEILFP